MPDYEAVENPEAFADPEEEAAAQNPDVGAGTPDTAPERVPRVTLLERLRQLWS